MSVAAAVLRAGTREVGEVERLFGKGTASINPLKHERFSKSGGPFDLSNMHYDPSDAATQANLIKQNQELRVAARAERVRNTRRQQGNVVNEDQSIPLTKVAESNPNNLSYSVSGSREADAVAASGGARGTVTPPERFGISREAYDANFENKTLSPFDEKSELERRFISSLDDSSTFGVSKENAAALGSANQRIVEAQETGNVVGLLRRQNELYNQSSRSGSVPQAGTPQGLEYGLLGDQISQMERAAHLGPGGYGPAAPHLTKDASKRLYSGAAYDDAARMRNNTATSTNAMSGGTNGPIPPSSSNRPISPGTTPTGSTDYSGRYVPSASVDQANEISGLLRPLESDTALGLASSVGMGALLGGSANYAMGGDFTEGAMMGGLAGGAIKIGSRAIQANESGIESYLQRSVLGDTYDPSTAVGAIRSMPSAPEGAGLMQRGAFNVLKSDSASMGMQSRYATIGGSMLSGVAFTGKRNDRRRGFNAHRGNRI